MHVQWMCVKYACIRVPRTFKTKDVQRNVHANHVCVYKGRARLCEYEGYAIMYVYLRLGLIARANAHVSSSTRTYVLVGFDQLFPGHVSVPVPTACERNHLLSLMPSICSHPHCLR